MYLTFSQYQTWGGELDEQEFFRYEFIASKDIDRITFGRVKTMSAIPEGVKRAMFELITICQSQIERKGVASETLDKWSRSYTGDLACASKDTIVQLLDGEVDDNGTPLTYCGVRG